VVLPWAALLGVATLVAVVRIRPQAAGQIGYDSAAAVLYFDRIMAGRHLEAFVAATPKALLTVVYGATHAIFGDWRVISALSVLVYGLNVTLAALLAKRLAGPVAAGFAAVGLIGSVALLEDASAAYAVGWAVLGWLVAGLALTWSRPRYALAGTALLLAGLARFETLLIAGTATVVLVGATVAARRWPSLRPPRAAWLLLISLAAFPLQMIHDWLLTGDPFWAEAVPAIVSADVQVIGPVTALQHAISHYLSMGPLVLLALLGAAHLVTRKAWAIALGLAVLGPGIVAFIVFLAARQIYISGRYFYPADIAVLFAASLGVGTLRVPVLRLRRISRDLPAALRVVGPILGGAIVAALVVSPYAPLDRDLTKKIRTNLALFQNVNAALPAMRAAIDAIPGVRAFPSDGSPRRRGDDRAVLLVPFLLQPRLAVDLGLPVTAISSSSAARISATGSYPAPGQIVYHDSRNDLPAAPFRLLEVTAPTTVGSIRIVPLAADPVRQFWLVRIDAP